MTKILKGDTSPVIALSLAEGFDYTGATVEVRYQGAVRKFGQVNAGDTVRFSFTAEETMPMAFGAHPVTVRIATANGGFFTVDSGGVMIEVTDDPAAVWVDGVIAVDAHGMLYGITDLPAHYTDKDVVAKIREILRKGGAALCVAFAACSMFGASIHTAAKQDIYNDGQIVTNVDFTGLATEDYVQGAVKNAGGMTEQGVRGIVTEMGSQFGKVKSVNGHEGEVVLSAGDIRMNTNENAQTVAQAISNATPSDYQSVKDKANAAATPADISSATENLRPKDDLKVYSGGWTFSPSSDTEYSQFKVEYSDDMWKLLGLSRASGEWYSITFDGDSARDATRIDFGYVVATRQSPTETNDTLAKKSELTPVQTKVEQALAYSQATYQYNLANTNAWFEGTNYNVNAEQAEHKVKYLHEDWEDVLFTPCSLQLYEIRDGERKVVWDQRDWTVYYWNFKSQQLSNNFATATHDLSEKVRTNYMKRGWAKYTAVNGLDNPDPSTLWIDTPKVQLMAGAQWEKLVEVGGAGYYTLTGNGIQLAPADAESTFLTIKDFEGNACLTFRKTSSYLVYCECGSDIVSNYMDSQNRVTFHLTTDVQPTAEFSTTLELDSFVEQGEDGCPANYEWTGSAGSWDCHFILKPGITSNACFARFKVMREGENVVEHTVPIKINGGIVFEQNGQTLKCKPVAQGTSVGSTVNWVIAQ